MPGFLRILIALALLGLPGAAVARNVALVIANSDYTAATALANPANDARLVARALGEAGFDSVEVAQDLTQDAMLAKLRSFRDAAQGADAALIYYAGHGIEGKGRNWLVPTDAGLGSETDLPYEAVELGLAMEALGGAKLRIAVLDACRNNPFANQWTGSNRAVSRGLAPVEIDDVLVIYAAAPGAVAMDGAEGNSPFARALARRIIQPGLPVQLLGGMVRDDVLAATGGEQRPFISASITGQPIYLVGGPADGLLPDFDAPGSPAPAASNADADLAAWEAALALDTAQGYRAYLAARPAGAFARFAEANIAQLLDPTALGGELNSSQRSAISVKAFLPGRYDVEAGAKQPIDGVWTIASIKRRIRIEGGRAFAVDGWNHAIVLRINPDQVVITNIVRTAPGNYTGRDLPLNGDAKLTLRKDGNIDVRVATFPFPIRYRLLREAIDDPAALAAETPD